MNFNLIISDPANQDLERIADYLGANYGLQRSETFINEINERMKYIASFPYIGRSREELLDRKSTRLNSSHLDLSRMPSSA